ncbi:hypothetical protein [Tenacibaculum singaporense]|nr:hypothetical protein [Tenacibaculum singaporense]
MKRRKFIKQGVVTTTGLLVTPSLIVANTPQRITSKKTTIWYMKL